MLCVTSLVSRRLHPVGRDGCSQDCLAQSGDAGVAQVIQVASIMASVDQRPLMVTVAQ